MALALSFAEGDRFFVADEPVKMARIVSDEHFVLQVRDEMFDVVGDKSVEILPDVVVSAGNSPEWEREVQVVIDAPRRIRILRERVYWREKGRDKERATGRTHSGVGS